MALSIECGAIFRSKPFIVTEPIVIVRINDGGFSPCQRYPAERIAIMKPAIHKHGKNQKAFEPERNVNDNLDNHPPGKLVY